jgi:hypothetical protein
LPARMVDVVHTTGGQTYRVRYVADRTTAELYAYMKQQASVGRCPIYLDGNYLPSNSPRFEKIPSLSAAKW